MWCDCHSAGCEGLAIAIRKNPWASAGDAPRRRFGRKIRFGTSSNSQSDYQMQNTKASIWRIGVRRKLFAAILFFGLASQFSLFHKRERSSSLSQPKTPAQPPAVLHGEDARCTSEDEPSTSGRSAELFWDRVNGNIEWGTRLGVPVINTTVLCIPRRYGRNANWHKQLRNLVFEAIMCGAVAMGTTGTMPNSPFLFLSGKNLIRPHRPCRQYDGEQLFFLDRHLQADELQVYQSWLPLLNRAALFFSGVREPERVKQRRCPSWLLSEETLIGHVRSGDMFFGLAPPHNHYGQPPLQFYIKAMSARQWKNITIFAEDLHNPVGRVLELLSKTIFKDILHMRVATSYDEVLFHWLCARNLVLSRSSASIALLPGSYNLRRVYTYGGCVPDIHFQFGFHSSVSIHALSAHIDYRRQVLEGWDRSWEKMLRSVVQDDGSGDFEECLRPASEARLQAQGVDGVEQLVRGLRVNGTAAYVPTRDQGEQLKVPLSEPKSVEALLQGTSKAVAQDPRALL